jgi:hypothetical protein
MPSVEVLIELLRKISKTKRVAKLEVNYDGRGSFSWKVQQNDLTASEFVAPCSVDSERSTS